MNDVELRATLADLHAAMLAAYAAGDLEALLAFYTEDAALIEPDKPPIRGRAAIERALRVWFERFGFDAGRCEVWEAEACGETAWDLSYCELPARRRSSGELFLERWKQLCLWRRQPDVGWKLHRLMFNSHRPAVPGSRPSSRPCQRNPLSCV